MLRKAYLMSVSAKDCYLIVTGKKTVIVRKTDFKIKAPFKVYLYSNAQKEPIRLKYIKEEFGVEQVGTKLYRFLSSFHNNVIGEFTCYEVTKSNVMKECLGYNYNSCMTDEEMYAYCGTKDFYNIHISDLKIYDKPKALSDFYNTCESTSCVGCEFQGWDRRTGSLIKQRGCTVNRKKPLKHAGCYVDERDFDDECV